MARTDTASRVVAAPFDHVYAALVDPEPPTAWLPPTGAGRFERFDARPGRSYRLVLTYPDESPRVILLVGMREPGWGMRRAVDRRGASRARDGCISRTSHGWRAAPKRSTRRAITLLSLRRTQIAGITIRTPDAFSAFEVPERLRPDGSRPTFDDGSTGMQRNFGLGV